jgi:type IV pilus assembly protein PilB
MPIVNWDAYRPNQELLDLIPEDVATKYTVFPYSIEQGKRQSKITLAVANPSNVFAIDDISFMTGCIIKTEISSARAIRQAIYAHYKGKEAVPGMPVVRTQQEQPSLKEEGAPSGIAEFDSLLVELAETTELAEEEVDVLSGLDREHPSTKFLFDLLDIAVDRGFSEIHIEPYGQEQRVRFSLHGLLHKHTLIPEQVGREIALRLHRIVQRADTSTLPKKEQAPWTGSFSTSHIRGKFLTVIVNFYPTLFGEKVLLKIKDDSSPQDVDDLGIDERSLKTLNRVLTKPHGLLLLVSPPKHGKSTTLYAILRKFCQSDRNIVSLEHPVESMIPGVNQIPFNPQMSYQDWCSLFSFSAPDLIALEKVESPLMVQLAFELASSSLVLASLTAPDFADGLCTFLSVLLSVLGKQPQGGFPLILDSINGIASQRLVRTICPYCKKEVSLSEQDVEFLRWLNVTDNDFGEFSVYSGKGCQECMETGYGGQTGLFEIVKLDKGLKQFLFQNQPIFSFQVRQFFTEMSTEDPIKQQAFRMIRNGLTSPAEIRRVLLQSAVGSQQ